MLLSQDDKHYFLLSFSLYSNRYKSPSEELMSDFPDGFKFKVLTVLYSSTIYVYNRYFILFTDT